MNRGGVQIIFILSIITHQCLKKWVLVYNDMFGLKKLKENKEETENQ